MHVCTCNMYVYTCVNMQKYISDNYNCINSLVKNKLFTMASATEQQQTTLEFYQAMADFKNMFPQMDDDVIEVRTCINVFEINTIFVWNDRRGIDDIYLHVFIRQY